MRLRAVTASPPARRSFKAASSPVTLEQTDDQKDDLIQILARNNSTFGGKASTLQAVAYPTGYLSSPACL